MDVTFTRTGERRYRVEVMRERAPALVMDPAPGFDPYLPHDLVHFVVECECEIRDGIFGQLAAGGDAGTFWTRQHDIRRKWERKGARLRKAASGTGRSEKLAHLAHVSWQRKHGHSVSEWDREAVELLPPEDRAQLTRALERLDELADRWHALGVGGSLTLRWPWAEGRLPSTGGTRRKRGGPRRRKTASGRAP
jgi:hypothetical protein